MLVVASDFLQTSHSVVTAAMCLTVKLTRRLDRYTRTPDGDDTAGLTVTHLRLLESYTRTPARQLHTVSYTLAPRLLLSLLSGVQRLTMTIDTEATINRTMAPKWL